MSYTWDTTTSNIGTSSWTTTGTVSIPYTTTITLDDEIFCAEDIKFLHKLKNQEKIQTKNNEKDTMMNLEFGPCGDRTKISPLGIAVKNTNDEWVSYDKEKHEIVNVDLLNFDNSNFIYMIPAAIKDIAEGDAIIHNKHIMFVKKIRLDGISVIDVADGEYKKILPTKSMFGFDYITKVVSILDFVKNDASEDNPFGNLLPLMLMDKNNSMLPFLLFNEKENIDPMLFSLIAMDHSDKNDMLPFILMQYLKK